MHLKNAPFLFFTSITNYDENAFLMFLRICRSIFLDLLICVELCRIISKCMMKIIWLGSKIHGPTNCWFNNQIIISFVTPRVQYRKISFIICNFDLIVSWVFNHQLWFLPTNVKVFHECMVSFIKCIVSCWNCSYPKINRFELNYDWIKFKLYKV